MLQIVCSSWSWCPLVDCHYLFKVMPEYSPPWFCRPRSDVELVAATSWQTRFFSLVIICCSQAACFIAVRWHVHSACVLFSMTKAPGYVLCCSRVLHSFIWDLWYSCWFFATCCSRACAPPEFFDVLRRLLLWLDGGTGPVRAPEPHRDHSERKSRTEEGIAATALEVVLSRCASRLRL